MNVEYSGWDEKRGSFSFCIPVDTTKSDYEIHFSNGFVAKQTSKFDDCTYDWNNDGDVYTQFGAWFESEFGGNIFWTPVDMVRELIEGSMATYGNYVIAIPGIKLPSTERKPSLDEQIRHSELQRDEQKSLQDREALIDHGIF